MEHGYCLVETELIGEIIAGDVKRLETLIAMNALSYTHDGGFSVLTAAVIADSLPMIKLLLQNGCTVNSNSTEELPPLMHAIRRRNMRSVEMLLQSGAVFYFEDYIENQLRSKIDPGTIQNFQKLLLTYGINVHDKNSLGKSLLHAAAKASYSTVGTDAHLQPEPSLKQLNNWERTVELLIRKGADINVRLADGSTCLHLAVEWPQALKIFLGHGADVDAKNDEGKTAIFFAAHHGYEDSLKLLLDFGANIKGNPNALIAAAARGNFAIVQALLMHDDVDVNFVDDLGFSALMHSALYGCNEVTNLLISNGACFYDINAIGEC